jgi:F-type H+-transporting ATPase subunit epsilon
MMGNTLALEIIDANGTYLNTTVSSLFAPTQLGQIGILPDHKPLIAVLDMGVLVIADANQKESHFFIKDGLLQVLNNKITLIPRVILSQKDLNLMDLKAELQTVEEMLHQIQKSILSMDQIEAALQKKNELQKKIVVAEKD